MKNILLFCLVFSAHMLFADEAAFSGWTQWGKDPQHTGRVHVNGQNLNRVIREFVYDPHAPAEMQASNGNLLVHYQAVLTGENDVFMATKTGTFTGTSSWQTQNWNERKFEWIDGTISQR